MFRRVGNLKLGKRLKGSKLHLLVFIPLVLTSFNEVRSQENPALSLEELLDLAIENNAGYRASSLNTEKADALVSNAFDFDKTELFYSYDENNLAFNGQPLKVFGVQQNFLFPTVYFAGRKVNMANLNLETSNQNLNRLILEREVVSQYYRLLYEMEKENIYKRLDSFYVSFAHAAKRRFETGETNYLERITAQAKQRQLMTLHQQSQEDVKSALLNLQSLVQSEESFDVAPIPLHKVAYKRTSIEENPGIMQQENRKEFFRFQKNFESQQLLPDLSLSYFQGTNSGLDQYLAGYHIGLKFPLLFSGNSSRIKASKIARRIAEQEAIDYRIKLEARQAELILQLNKYDQMLSYFEDEGQNLSQEIFKTAKYSFENGEINFFQYLQSIENALEILLDYMVNLNLYNQTAIELNYLTL